MYNLHLNVAQARGPGPGSKPRLAAAVHGGRGAGGPPAGDPPAGAGQVADPGYSGYYYTMALVDHHWQLEGGNVQD